MQKFGKSQPVKRVEDVRFLTGHGRYIDDIAPKDALFAVVVRSPVAHGRITGLDVSEAREAPGVHLVLTLADLEEAGLDPTLETDPIDTIDGGEGIAPERPILARDKVRFVGDPVAFVVAESLAEARDAAEMVELDIDDLPAHVVAEAGGEPLYDEAPDNRAFEFGLGDEATVDAAIRDAAHVVRCRVEDNRIIVNSMEPRGCYAEIEGNRLHLALGGQGVWGTKDNLSRMLKLDRDDIRVTTPDVGGGFGMKGADYPEYALVAHAARTLGRPVRWIADRTESMLTDNGGRDLVSTATLAFDAEHRITAYRVDTTCNLGANNSDYAQHIQTELFSKVMCGTYAIPAAWLHVEGFFTNTVQTDAYRGAGRPEAIFVLERSMDAAARELGLDPLELRRRNFIPPDRFPYTSATGVTYDVGEFDRVLTRTESEADLAGFAARRKASEAQGKLRGVGLCYYIESILGDKNEDARVEFEADGGVALFVGTQSNGQGHETVYARFLADQTGIPAEQIRVVQGDSDLIARGGGTGGSRSVTTQNNATLAAVGVMTRQFAEFLADEEGVDAAEISFDDERFRIPGSNLTPTMVEVAEMARAKGREDILTIQATGELERMSFPNGCHVAEVEIDPETGKTELVKYTVVDDFGNLINPLLAEGQVHGGVAQGVGQTLTERAVYDSEGQLLTATFMDYAMPRAYDLPMIAFHSEPVPSKNNPMGMKGCGEAGTVGALAAVTNAVQDALWDRGIREVQPPFTPQRVWELLTGAEQGAAA
ncbi:xanthine dehydrogenase family protein molybdopterin-binding subunit [Histidinibacterium aquaticum]|uniref:Xanthine dehydrogenase family protein molybdopterin-binding subunit n=1 Tax=Histidinibacterium aquaticum TaxID=2613962 RepID=A0A5J5GIM5_9RHOB|nr:xanthine dehydrogenase family protein molybdopterin-binding subunit [Histidinibacterium aquaticum]KAA9008086.1 xanthine dehydrogenase family protein molybdopterin-binding subunit [Histidinibacterium aquaticum]